MAIGTTAALIGGTVASSVIGASSANKAANAQVEAANQASAVQLQIHQENLAAQQPWLQGGETGLNALMYELGLGEAPTVGGTLPEIVEVTDPGYAQNLNGSLVQNRMAALQQLEPETQYQVGSEIFTTRQEAEAYANNNRIGGETYAGYESSPGYEFQLGEGLNALASYNSARGTRLGGAAQKAAMEYGQGLASQDYSNYLNRLAGVAGVGQTATAQNQASGTNYANAVGNNYLAAGNARASGYAGVNSALQGGIQNYSSILGMQAAGYL